MATRPIEIQGPELESRRVNNFFVFTRKLVPNMQKLKTAAQLSAMMTDTLIRELESYEFEVQDRYKQEMRREVIPLIPKILV